MSENLKKVKTAVAVLIAAAILYFFFRLVSISFDSPYITAMPPCMCGYYESTPAFLESAEVSSMSVIIKDCFCRILYQPVDRDELSEVDCDINILSGSVKDSIISLDCKVESDVEHPMTNTNLNMSYNRDTGEIVIMKKNVVVANMVKDNMISIHM